MCNILKQIMQRITQLHAQHLHLPWKTVPTHAHARWNNVLTDSQNTVSHRYILNLVIHDMKSMCIKKRLCKFADQNNCRYQQCQK